MNEGMQIVLSEDEAREARISELTEVFNRANKVERPRIWSELVAEIKARSPEQVRRMEEDRGLL